ncbi:hypothetical protein NQ318_018923 [Aromia moschata]|uniref:Cytochrome b5 heme-binding domain-containing protein n=1 Tax=Aromia moschata TaxID=1265417 RepID=A0AAV8ZGM1_9CUCU|nr:hypothetical protein NQ318_018923 [Aromia moschata]
MSKDEKFEIKFKDNKYNIYEFLNNHPGGINYVRPYEQKDVAKRMKDFDHSNAAYYLLKEYKDGGRSKDQAEGEDLEYLVDWDKPMLSQVANLGHKYKEWVLSPVDRQLRLFGNPVIENLTITPCLTRNLRLTHSSPILPSVLNIGLGVLVWTVVEYSLHRWVFHMEPSGDSKVMIYLHFAIHGLHHKVPFDSRRLVFPPLPAAIIAFLLYKVISLIFPESTRILIMAGGLTGYVIYDMIHFYLHHGTPKEDTYFYHLKRYHNQHHFAHHDSGFGISSVLWDKIFGTVISLRKLNLGIRW